MSTALYDKARAEFLKGSDGAIAMSSGGIKAVLVTIGVGHYVADLANDQYLSSIASGDRVATSANLTNKTFVAGVFDADDVTWATVPASVAGAIVLYYDTKNPATSPLIAYIDNATGLPITSNGASVTIAWDNSASRIFKL